jgi:hypothetical protein
MLKVAISIRGGVVLALTMSETKFAVNPMIVIKQAACSARLILKAAARAP